MPTTASASDPSDAHTVQQLALVLGRKGLQHAAESMRQHRAAVQRSANTAYHSHLSLELLSSVNWLPSWYKHATSQQAHQQVPAATTADWYAEDMYDDIQEEAEFIALQQAKLGQESESMPTTAGTRVPAKSYAAHMPSLKTCEPKFQPSPHTPHISMMHCHFIAAFLCMRIRLVEQCGQ